MDSIISIISKLLTASIFFYGCWYIWIKKLKTIALQLMIKDEEKLEELETHHAYLLSQISLQEHLIIQEKEEINLLKDKYTIWVNSINHDNEQRTKKLLQCQEKMQTYSTTQQRFFVKKQAKKEAYLRLFSLVRDQLQINMRDPKHSAHITHAIINQLPLDKQ